MDERLTIDVKTISEAGFDEFLNRDLFPVVGELVKRQLDAYNFAGGIIGDKSVIYLGSKLVKLDGSNQRILISDGVNNRVVIGKLN